MCSHDSQKPVGASLPGSLSGDSQRGKRIQRAGRRQGFALQWAMPALTRRRVPPRSATAIDAYIGALKFASVGSCSR